MPKQINVEQKTQRIVVEPATSTIAVVSAGPMGPTGPAGSVSQATLDAVEAGLQAQIDSLQSQINLHHP
jgi:hypothetical protein